MANSLFERFGGGTPPASAQASGSPDLLRQIRANPRAYVAELKADPAAFVRRCGYEIPDGMTDPQQIIQALFGARGR